MALYWHDLKTPVIANLEVKAQKLLLSMLRTASYHLFLVIVSSLFYACGSTSINDTAYEYTYNLTESDTRPEKIFIAPINFGIPSKSYLQPYEQYIDNELQNYLEQAGFHIVESTVFETAWRNAKRKYGSPYNASESKVNPKAFRQTMLYVLDEIKNKTDADAVLFTDLMEQMVVFTGANGRRAKWHGVSRLPKTVETNQTSADFNWAQPVPAISLRVIVYSTEGELLFKSFGGLEVARQLDATKGRFIRRKSLFTSDKNVAQGISIALHPFVPLQN